MKSIMIGLSLLFAICFVANSQTVKTKSSEGDMKSSVLYDVVLSGGRVIDPETKLDAIKNVGIINNRIAQISNETLQGKETKAEVMVRNEPSLLPCPIVMSII